MSHSLPALRTFPVQREFAALVGRMENHSFFSRNRRYSMNRSRAYTSSSARSAHAGSAGIRCGEDSGVLPLPLRGEDERLLEQHVLRDLEGHRRLVRLGDEDEPKRDRHQVRGEPEAPYFNVPSMFSYSTWMSTSRNVRE